MLLATENDSLNAVSMMFGHLLTNSAAIFADVRTYWSPDAVERVTGKKLEGKEAGGFIHLINSGSAALDATGCSRDSEGRNVMKPWYEMQEKDVSVWKQSDGVLQVRGTSKGEVFPRSFIPEARCP